MKSETRGKVILLVMLSAFVASCSRQDDTPEVALKEATPPLAAAAEPKGMAEEISGLGGTAWRLVKIMSMDDNTYVPEVPASYTLSFGTDGTMSIMADCNRGAGTWTSDSKGQLTFGPIAATMAMCSPESLHDRYMSQFEWVRSYVMRDGHLFLATMADGSIIEFEPLSE